MLLGDPQHMYRLFIWNENVVITVPIDVSASNGCQAISRRCVDYKLWQKFAFNIPYANDNFNLKTFCLITRHAKWPTIYLNSRVLVCCVVPFSAEQMIEWTKWYQECDNFLLNWMDKTQTLIFTVNFFTNIYFAWRKGDLAGALTTQLCLFGIKVLGPESCVTYWAHIF